MEDVGAETVGKAKQTEISWKFCHNLMREAVV